MTRVHDLIVPSYISMISYRFFVGTPIEYIN